MRRWVEDWCGECGRADGRWEDVAEGPITPAEAERRKWNQEMFERSGWAGLLYANLFDAHAVLTPTDPDATVTFQIKNDLSA